MEVIRKRIDNRYMEEKYEKICDVCYDIIIEFNRDIIKMVMEYIKESMYEYKLNEVLGNYKIIEGEYIYFNINGYGIYNINVKENIGKNIDINCQNQYVDGTCYPYNKIKQYGRVYEEGYIDITNKIYSDTKIIEENNKFNWYMKLRYEQDYVSIYKSEFTLMMKSQDMPYGTIYQNILDNNQNKYYLMMIGKNRNCLIELEEDEYNGIIIELGEVRKIIGI